MSDDYTYLFKIILIGDSGVGKTSLLKRYTDKIFEKTYISTIGVDFKVKTIDVNNEKVKLQLWDTAGQERFRTITNSYYRGSHGILIIFDVTGECNVDTWKEEVLAQANKDAEILVLGNKADLPHKKTEYVEVSAKSGENVENAFYELASKLVCKVKNGEIKIGEKKSFDVNALKQKKYGCC